MRTSDLAKRVLPALAIATAILIAVHYVFFIYPVTSPTAHIQVTVEPGMTVAQMANELKASGVIDNPFLFRIIARIRGVDRKMRAGQYLFDRNESEASVVAVLVKGGAVSQKVTIPEGYTLRQIAALLAHETAVDSSLFLSLTSDTALMDSLGIRARTLEGYLFPDTYDIFWRMDPSRVIRIMVGKLFEVLDQARQNRADSMGYTVHEILTMASMVEREALLAEEKPLIAGVLYRRLAISMPLQCDATIQYVMPEHKDILSYSDLDVKSPYNTYMHYGLPPGPICSPGAGSIMAALYPEKTDFLYYVAKGDGSHIFSKTVQEHDRARMVARLNREALKEGFR
jgi:UPF0755 protein